MRRDRELARGLNISGPVNFERKVHVDCDFNWSSDGASDPNTVFEMGDKLGEGAFGCVYRAKFRVTGFPVAIKVLRSGGSRNADIEQEVNLLRKVDHKNVIRYFGSCTSPATNELWVCREQ